MSATVHLVGAGPGAADLLTVRAARLLGEADIVFYDALVPCEILSLVKTQRRVAVGKRSGRHATAQRFINKQLVDAARRHRTVVRLKGGDPMLFGRAHEEIAALQREDIRVEVVPGITAALAASAELRVSLTRRGAARSVTFVTPRVGEGERESTWIQAVLAADTAAIYMGAGEAEAIHAALIAAGKPADTPVAVVESASLPSTVHAFGVLGELPSLARSNGGPMLILLGEVYAEAVAARAERPRRAIHAA
ncbi:MAG TPA: uroporphyrinogen-III C-methyltransferase [Burkholderiales bacterium]|nr:uroporphyrinogen-III C-methyltransferase [Burkholderiales bacterium]